MNAITLQQKQQNNKSLHHDSVKSCSVCSCVGNYISLEMVGYCHLFLFNAFLTCNNQQMMFSLYTNLSTRTAQPQIKARTAPFVFLKLQDSSPPNKIKTSSDRKEINTQEQKNYSHKLIYMQRISIAQYSMITTPFRLEKIERGDNYTQITHCFLLITIVTYI